MIVQDVFMSYWIRWMLKVASGEGLEDAQPLAQKAANASESLGSELTPSKRLDNTLFLFCCHTPFKHHIRSYARMCDILSSMVILSTMEHVSVEFSSVVLALVSCYYCSCFHSASRCVKSALL